MSGTPAKVLAHWDSEADVWVATSYDIPGLALAASTKEELVHKIQLVAADLLEANVGSVDYDSIVVEYIKQETTPSLRVA